jgi:hypothetical protein
VRGNVQLIFLIAAIGNCLIIRSYNGKGPRAHIVYSPMNRGPRRLVALIRLLYA